MSDCPHWQAANGGEGLAVGSVLGYDLLDYEAPPSSNLVRKGRLKEDKLSILKAYMGA